MCYYDYGQYTCGCWKWDKFRKQCDREWRIGETCGLKMFNNRLYLDGICSTCEKLRKKENRYVKTMSDYNRWKDDPKLQASAEKACRDARQIWNEMEELKKERERRYMNVGSNRKMPMAGPSNGQSSMYASGQINGGKMNGNGVLHGH